MKHDPDFGTLGSQWIADQTAEAQRQDAEAMEPREDRAPPGAGIALAAMLAAAFWCFVGAAILAARVL